MHSFKIALNLQEAIGLFNTEKIQRKPCHQAGWWQGGGSQDGGRQGGGRVVAVRMVAGMVVAGWWQGGGSQGGGSTH